MTLGCEPAELFTNLQNKLCPSASLPALPLRLTLEKSQQPATKNPPQPGLLDDSPTKAGEHSPRLTNLLSTPSPFFQVPRKSQSISQQIPQDLSDSDAVNCRPSALRISSSAGSNLRAAKRKTAGMNGLCNLPAVWPRESYLTSLSFSCFSCKMASIPPFSGLLLKSCL